MIVYYMNYPRWRCIASLAINWGIIKRLQHPVIVWTDGLWWSGIFISHGGFTSQTTLPPCIVYIFEFRAVRCFLPMQWSELPVASLFDSNNVAGERTASQFTSDLSLCHSSVTNTASLSLGCHMQTLTCMLYNNARKLQTPTFNSSSKCF